MMALMDKAAAISLEAKGGLLFGAFALVISLLFSLLAGNEFGVIVTRALMFTVIYAAIGYAALMIIKRVVPEVYDILNNSLHRIMHRRSDNDEAAINMNSNEGDAGKNDVSAANTDSYQGNSAMAVSDKGFAEAFVPSDSTDYTTVRTHGKGKKMGKHIILDDKKMQYEPKIMADAIRTMLKRD